MYKCSRIVTNPYVSGWNGYYRYQHQKSDVEYLDMSEDYILAAEFKDGSGGDYVQVNSI